MGQVSTEQTVAIIEAVQQDPRMHADPNMNFWPLLLLAVIPVILAPFVATWVQKRRANADKLK